MLPEQDNSQQCPPTKRTDRRDLHEIRTAQGKERELRYIGGFVDLDYINVLPQGRKTFEEIDLLAEDVASKNLINPPLVARLNQEGACDYLNTINSIWGTDFKLEDLTKTNEDGEEKYYLLIAGERRYRACRKLEKDACRDHAITDENNGCFSQHFPDGLEVRICNNIPPLEAIYLQATENTYMSIPPHEEAHYYDALMRTLKRTDSNYSLAQFARDVGRSESKIRDAFRFCRIPTEIQQLVEEGHLSYGIAVEIGRLVEANVDQGDIDFYITGVLGGRYTAMEISKLVSSRLNYSSQDQGLLFSPEADVLLKAGNTKRIVERESINAIWAWIYYFKQLINHFNQGRLGKDDSSFSSASPLRVYRNLLEVQSELLPHLQELITDAEFRKMDQILIEQEEAVGKLIELTPSDYL